MKVSPILLVEKYDQRLSADDPGSNVQKALTSVIILSD
jgi:hypothetical protein